MKVRIALAFFLAAFIICAGYAALFVAPDESTMHEVQRIFYMHVPVWIAMYIAIAVAFVANVAWLRTHQISWDWLGVSAVEVTVVCCTIGLISGVLWGRPAWGIWWTWDARLTSTFILWMLYVAYLLLRGLIEDPQRKATLSAVFGVFASLDAPLVYFSNRLFRTQHPSPVFFGGPDSGIAPEMARVFLLCMVVISCIAILILVDRYRLERLRFEYEELRQEVESRSLDSQSASGKDKS